MTGRLFWAAVLALVVSLLITGSAVGLNPPAVTITSPAPDALVNGATTTIEGLASEPSEVTVTVKLGPDVSGPALLTESAIPAEDEKWSLELALADGLYTVVAEQTNAALNTGESAPQSFTVDTLEPVVTVTSPAPDALVNDATPTIAGSASEPSEVTVKIWLATDTLGSPLQTATAIPAGDGTWSLELALADGLYTVVAGQTDAAANLGESTPRSFTVDTVPPTVPPPPPPDTTAPGAVVLLTARSGDHRATLTWRKPPDADLLRVVVRRGTTVVYRGLEKESLIDRGLYNGTVYTYRFTAVDVAGNVSAVTSVKVKPRGKLWSPRDGGVIRVAPTLQWAKVSRATYYNVQLWRNGRKILSRWPTRPTYELRMRWRYGGRIRNLRDGTYLWYVWPGFGDRERGRYGRMLGSATFFKR